MADHYFSESPQSPERPRSLTVALGGREVEVRTTSGVFSPTRLDLGTQVLLRAVPDPPAGTLLDLGCGWGPIALHAGLLARDAGRRLDIWALDVNERSLDLTARNAQALSLTAVRPVRADDVPADLRFDTIWSNPPIRVGKEVLHELLTTWLPRLRPGGEAWLVVAKNLGADSLRDWLAAELAPEMSVAKHSSAKGYRVLVVRREGPEPGLG